MTKINVFKAIGVAKDVIKWFDDEINIDTTDEAVTLSNGWLEDNDTQIEITITEKEMRIRVRIGNYEETKLFGELPPDSTTLLCEVVQGMINNVEGAYYKEEDVKRRENVLSMLPKCVEWREYVNEKCLSTFVFGKITIGLYCRSSYRCGSYNSAYACNLKSMLIHELKDLLYDVGNVDDVEYQDYKKMFKELTKKEGVHADNKENG